MTGNGMANQQLAQKSAACPWVLAYVLGAVDVNVISGADLYLGNAPAGIVTYALRYRPFVERQLKRILDASLKTVDNLLRASFLEEVLGLVTLGVGFALFDLCLLQLAP